MPELLHTAIAGLPPARLGKVREVYDLGDALLMVATDRISAFDAVMANGIPEKGAILTQLSAFWFGWLPEARPNHLLSVDDAEIQSRLPKPEPMLNRRSMLVRKARPLSIECVARGYIAGSLFKEYREEGGWVLGLALPPGLIEAQRLSEPIFTPAAKNESGHDENLSFAQAVDLVGRETAERVRDWTLDLYAAAARHCEARGILLADTKFEFGETEDGLILIDEALTPDSSRFWPANRYAPGQSPPSYDKQFVRDYLESTHWDKQSPGPMLPSDVVEATRVRYVEAYERLTGEAWRA
jgi:phosphoribosylaminoimidazole-succinocarboxamide synthase